ncbi:uncharacterized protein LOC117876487 [Trachemys scripta elegans]|uniref:uncharacterized protein LOC117876487 n=1 Tax=Trachemys scripta elegans TaxID=31138 RepID=UPI00155329D8|nr:uncharacterized protein LOC117876487 [Trachemys scripta elegans]
MGEAGVKIWDLGNRADSTVGGATKRDAEDHAFIPGILLAEKTDPSRLTGQATEEPARVHNGTGANAAATGIRSGSSCEQLPWRPTCFGYWFLTSSSGMDSSWSRELPIRNSFAWDPSECATSHPSFLQRRSGGCSSITSKKPGSRICSRKDFAMIWCSDFRNGRKRSWLDSVTEAFCHCYQRPNTGSGFASQPWSPSGLRWNSPTPCVMYSNRSTAAKRWLYNGQTKAHADALLQRVKLTTGINTEDFQYPRLSECLHPQ